MKNKLDKNLILVFQKLFLEAYVFILLGCFLFFISEIILPGFLSARINFSTVYVILFLSTVSISAIDKSTGEKTISKEKISNKMAVFLSLIATIFISTILRPLPYYYIIVLIPIIFLSILFLFVLIVNDPTDSIPK